MEAAGGDAVVLDAASGGVFSVEDYDGVVILGGGDVDPARYGGDMAAPDLHGVDTAADEAEIDLAVGAAETGRPLLGICRGLHVINVAFGGSLIEDLGPDSAHKIHRENAGMAVHEVGIEPGTLLATVVGQDRITVASGHHQAVRRLGDGLRVSAAAPDGVIEAVESARPGQHWVLAVQWHPEGTLAPRGQLAALLAPFLDACRRRDFFPSGGPESA